MNEIVYWLPDDRALVTGDVVIASAARPVPRVWSENMKPETLENVLRSLRLLLDVPVELLLLRTANRCCKALDQALREALDRAAARGSS